RSETVASQERLRGLLKGEGVDVTQATLSRGIRELGLAKVAAPDGGSHYAPPPEAGLAIRPQLAQVLPTLLVSVDGVGPLLVVKTPAGSAQALRRAIDGAGGAGDTGHARGVGRGPPHRPRRAPPPRRPDAIEGARRHSGVG